MIQDSINQMIGTAGVAAALSGKDVMKEQKDARSYIQGVDSTRINAMAQLKKMDTDMTPEAIEKLSPTERENAIQRYQDLNNQLVNTKMTMESPEYARNLRKTGKKWKASNEERKGFLEGTNTLPLQYGFSNPDLNKDIQKSDFGLLQKGAREGYIRNLDERFGIQTNQGGINVNAPSKGNSGIAPGGVATNKSAIEKGMAQTENDMKGYADMAEKFKRLKQLLQQPDMLRTKSKRINEAQKILKEGDK